MAKSPKAPKGSRPASRAVRVYTEAGITLPIGDPDDRAYIKYTFGHERIAPSDSPADLKRTEKLAYEACSQVVEARLQHLARLKKQVEVEIESEYG